jgi:hypothetical protein
VRGSRWPAAIMPVQGGSASRGSSAAVAQRKRLAHAPWTATLESRGLPAQSAGRQEETAAPLAAAACPLATRGPHRPPRHAAASARRAACGCASSLRSTRRRRARRTRSAVAGRMRAALWRAYRRARVRAWRKLPRTVGPFVKLALSRSLCSLQPCRAGVLTAPRRW